MKRKRKPVRIVPVYRKGKEHEGHVDGWIVTPEDRVVRELPPAREMDDKGGGNEVSMCGICSKTYDDCDCAKTGRR